MTYPCPVSVLPIKNYKLLISFDSGERKEFDVLPYIRGDWYGKLKDINYFNSVHISNKHVEWSGGQDIAPHELYECSVLVD